MRVAFLNRERTYPGGDLVAIDATMAALRERGIECEYMPTDVNGYDVVHIFHVNFGFSYANWRRVRNGNKPYVITPVFYPEEHEMSRRDIGQMLSGAKMVMPFSVAEGMEMQEWINTPIAFRPIPNGTDTAFHHPNGNGDRNGICSVAARINGKGREKLRDACLLARVQFAFITDVPHRELSRQYSRYRVFVSASPSERMSLVIGEALCAGCRVLATSANRGNEWYPGLAVCNPTAPAEEWAGKIAEAYSAGTWDFAPNAAARQLTWDQVAAQLTGIYQEALS